MQATRPYKNESILVEVEPLNTPKSAIEHIKRIVLLDLIMLISNSSLNVL